MTVKPSRLTAQGFRPALACGHRKTQPGWASRYPFHSELKKAWLDGSQSATVTCRKTITLGVRPECSGPTQPAEWAIVDQDLRFSATAIGDLLSPVSRIFRLCCYRSLGSASLDPEALGLRSLLDLQSSRRLHEWVGWRP